MEISKEVSDILTDIENGKPFTYQSSLYKDRVYTICIGSDPYKEWKFIIKSHKITYNIKNISTLNTSKAATIINAVLVDNHKFMNDNDYCTCPDFGYYEIADTKLCNRCNRKIK